MYQGCKGKLSIYEGMPIRAQTVAVSALLLQNIMRRRTAWRTFDDQTGFMVVK